MDVLAPEPHIAGMFDLDSPMLNRFDATDQAGLGRLAAVPMETIT
jgi:putative methionine-R-sulfoxide reductase with GAF domain